MNLPVLGKCLRSNVQSPRRLNLLLKSKTRETNRIDGNARRLIREVANGLPYLCGSPIFVFAQPHLKAYRGELFSGRHERGMPVHAASFIRRRAIVLETQLLNRPQKLRRILAHEIFHFVWARLGNRLRAEYTGIVEQELAARARGEMGESAKGWKSDIRRGGDFKNYVCESFCDTAAWLYSGARQNPELTLGLRWRQQRRLWFDSVFVASRTMPC